MHVRNFIPHLVLTAAVLAIPGGSGYANAGQESNDSQYWAFNPVNAVTVPDAKSNWVTNEIDSFVVAELQKRNLSPNPPADKNTLLRRVYFDLIGLPPTPEQMEAFLNDNSPDAFANVVVELLASVHYGERWGRHWLDLARYADTSGDGADAPIPEARLYRDYVIDAFNGDLPYDQFLIEQVAGDILAIGEPGIRERERMIATGYVALTRRFNNKEYADMHLVVDNTLTTISKGMLGLNFSCARCHDHKFDPISMDDYYGMYGYFSSTQYPHAGTEHGRQRKNFVTLPEGDLAYAVRDKIEVGETGDAPLFVRGDPNDPGEWVPRGFLDCIDQREARIPQGQSGRLQLARWIASPENPLTARVMANRIWQYHFGTGLVPTSSDFGKQGKPPTHPELLDWLAGQFVQQGWSIKEMHRLIMSSATYQQSSQEREANLKKDPANQWLWRFPRLRLEAEPMRDAVLFVSGRLKPGNPGRHPFPEPDEDDKYPFTQHKPFTEDYDHEHRSVYLPSRRLAKHPFMGTFNGPDTNECTANRQVSTVPLQSLFWMNSDFIQENARSLALRLLNKSQAPGNRIEMAYRLALSRSPTPGESREFLDYLEDYQNKIESVDAGEREVRSWTSLCRVLLASNEFIYID